MRLNRGGDCAECYEAKSNLLFRLKRWQELATTSWKAEWKLAQSLLHWLRIEGSNRGLAPPSTLPLSAAEVFDGFCKVLWVSRAHYTPLGNIMRELKLAPHPSNSCYYMLFIRREAFRLWGAIPSLIIGCTLVQACCLLPSVIIFSMNLCL